MCKADENGFLPTTYFKEIRNLQTGEQIEIKPANILDQTKPDKHLNPLVQNNVPNRPAGVTSIIKLNEVSPKTQMTPVTINNNKNKRPTVTPATQYCREHYNLRQAWKNVQAEQAEYIELLKLQNKNIHTAKNIPEDIQCIPCLQL